ncbi:MAG: cytochrome c oxidase assembly protein [Actinomycetota bacterium]
MLKPFLWNGHLEVLVPLTALLAAYYWAVRVWGPKHTSPGDPAITNSQKRYFVAGVIVVWLAASSPLHELSEDYLFSAHMLQHFMLSLIAAPLLLMGLPGWMVRQLLKPPAVMAVMRRITRPIPALFAFNGFLLFSHWPGFVNASARSEPFHLTAHVVLMSLSLLMWWPVLSPMPELPRAGNFAQFLYILAQTIAPAIPFAFLIFAERPLYSFYASAPRVVGWLDPVTDQRVAGLVMKMGGSALLWAVAAVLFFRWYSSEQAGTPATVEWQNLERELNAAPSSKEQV